MKKLIIIIAVIIIIYPYSAVMGADNLAERLAGRILLQVESNGEAWYVSPDSLMRHYLGRPEDAFELMRKQGVGITNANLIKIPVGLTDLSGIDSDGDGLSDMIEDALGTSKTNNDSDSDGHGDKEELENGYNPAGSGEIQVDVNLSKKHTGKIFLQVESHGEAWYINPADNKRYFLGRPADAFSIMRSLGLGISDNDLEQILILTPNHTLSQIEREIHNLINNERSSKGLDLLARNEDLAAVAREHSQNLAKENKALTGLETSCDFAIIHHEGLGFGIYNVDRLNTRDIYYFSHSGENIALMPGVETKTIYATTFDETQAAIDACQYKRDKFDEQFKATLEREDDEAKKLEIVRGEITKRTQAFTEEKQVEIAEIEWKTQAQLSKDTVRGWMESPGHRKNILTSEFDETGIGAAYVNGYVVSTQIFIKRASCGFENGPCCEEAGYYPYCFVPLECGENNMCEREEPW